MVSTDRRTLLASLGAGGAALAGCLDGRTVPGAFGGRTEESGGSGVAPPTVDRALPAAYDVEELEDAGRSGGPEPDGIPAIENPRFAEASDPPGLLDENDPVFGVEIDGEAKAYRSRSSSGTRSSTTPSGDDRSPSRTARSRGRRRGSIGAKRRSGCPDS